MELVCTSSSVEQTRALGAAVASVAEPGDVIALSGDLGAGKTVFVQGAAAALGVRSPVQSPSFVLVREYEGRMRVLHADAYRLLSLQELIDLGYEELFASDAVLFIEWGDAVDPLLPRDRLEVEIHGQADEERRIVLRAPGESWATRLRLVERDVVRA